MKPETILDEGFADVAGAVLGASLDLVELATEATRKLGVASDVIARLTVEVSVLRGQLAARDAELVKAWARIEKLQKREKAFIRELIREMTYTAELTETIENGTPV